MSRRRARVLLLFLQSFLIRALRGADRELNGTTLAARFICTISSQHHYTTTTSTCPDCPDARASHCPVLHQARKQRPTGPAPYKQVTNLTFSLFNILSAPRGFRAAAWHCEPNSVQFEHFFIFLSRTSAKPVDARRAPRLAQKLKVKNCPEIIFGLDFCDS